MDLNQIKQILDLVREHEPSEFEIEHEGLRLKIRKDANGTVVHTLPAAVLPAIAPSAGGGATAAPASPPAAAAPRRCGRPAIRCRRRRRRNRACRRQVADRWNLLPFVGAGGRV